MAARQGGQALRRAAAAAAPAAGEEMKERGMAAEHGRRGIAAARARSVGWRRARGGLRPRRERRLQRDREGTGGPQPRVERRAARMTRGERETCVFLFFFLFGLIPTVFPFLI